jgi:lipoprotein-releasing system ATP-binding protein
VALVAPSGAGKSTLLHIAGCWTRPMRHGRRDRGEDMTGASDRRAHGGAAGQVGFVYQFHHLLPEFTALENVVLPQLAHGVGAGRRGRERAAMLLDRVGLAERAGASPGGAVGRRAAARGVLPGAGQRAAAAAGR